MRSTQDKFMADVEAIATDMGMELVRESGFSNTGRLMITFEDVYEPIVDFTYSFQQGYASFEGVPNPKMADRIPEPGKTDYRKAWPATKFTELPKILHEIRQITARALNERRAAEIASFSK